MQPVSATDAIGLAFTHTRTVLAPGPFRLGRFFKLALLAAVTQASFLSVSINYPLQGGWMAARSHRHHAVEQLFAGDGIGAIAGGLALGIFGVISLLVLLFTLVYLYLLCRARATLFDLVVFRGGRVREAWRRSPARRYLGLYMLAMVLFLTVMAAVAGPFFVRFIKLSMLSVGQAGGAGATPAAGSLMLTLLVLIWILIPLWIAIDALLQDFILPGLLLDREAPMGAAFARLGSVFRQSPGQLVLFLILRTIVAFGVGLALGIVTLVGVGIVALSGYGVGRLLYNSLWTGGLGARTVFFAYVSGAVLVVATLYLLAITAVYGITGTFKTSYAAWFYAGYYPELAAALEDQPPSEEGLVGAGLPSPGPILPPLKARGDIW
jgi:hypothetical protein